jgi:hypothetical protein
MKRRGQVPDAITFANVGSEKKETYEFIPVMQEWLKSVGFPPITIVQYRPKSAPYNSLEGNMILNATLPGATFNMGSCTDKFKIQPQERWTRKWPPALEAWAKGIKVLRYIGFEAGEDHRLKRADAKAHAGKMQKGHAEKFQIEYPLVDWGYGLDKCIDIIKSEGLPVPVKSACFFCPNQKKHEVHELSDEDRGRVMLMELVAEPYNKKVRGLWRQPRKNDGRPGSITEYILQQKLTFTPLTVLGKRVVLNPACKKAKVGGDHTFDGPHQGPTLRQQLLDAGHEVPEVVVPEGGEQQSENDYTEDWRQFLDDDTCAGCGYGDADESADEHDRHMELIEAI